MRVGVDLGGTKIESICLDPSGEEVFRKRVANPRGSYQAILKAVVDLVMETEQVAGTACKVGIGMPGSVSPLTGKIRNANSTELNGEFFQQDLQKLLNRQVWLENDANCFVLSEAVDGAGQEVNTVFGVIIGTGCGGGLVVNKAVHKGRNAIAGEWGHNSLPWPDASELPGSDCYCGRQGCIETFLSGPGMSNDYYMQTHEQISVPDIVKRAENNDKQAIEVLQCYQRRMAKALASVINIIDPDVIVLGGGVSNIKTLYQTVPVLWKEYVFADTVNTALLPAQYGDSSGVRGAAWLPSS